MKTRFFHGEIAKDRHRHAGGKNATEREQCSFLARASKRVAQGFEWLLEETAKL
jgi:hypothetical protein